jgi:hypothetical protein
VADAQRNGEDVKLPVSSLKHSLNPVLDNLSKEKQVERKGFLLKI